MADRKLTKNEKGQILYATILPILILVAILVGTGFFLLRGEYTLPSFSKDETEIRRLEGFPTIVSDVGAMEKQRVVIRSQEELNNFLSTVDPQGNLSLKENINFKREFLVGVATDTNEMYGYDIKVKRLIVDKEDNRMTVEVREVEPGEDCDEDTVPNIAVDLVAISNTDKEIDFERIKEMKECEEPNI